MKVCNICHGCKRIHHNRKIGKPLCRKCYKRLRYHDPSTYRKCSKCGELKPVAVHTDDGPVCSGCYQKERYHDSSLHKKCSKCGEVRYIVRRIDGDKFMCNSCYQRTKVGRCIECGEVKVIQAGGYCYKCYQRRRRASKRRAIMADRPA